MITEAKLTKKFLDKLKIWYAGAWVLKLNLMSKAGVPDALVLYDGKAFFIEFKRHPYTVTALQLLTMRTIWNGAKIRTWVVIFHEDHVEVQNVEGSTKFINKVVDPAIRFVVETP